MLRNIGLSLLLCLAGWLCFEILEGQRDGAIRERDSALFEVKGLREAARLAGEQLAARDDIDRTRTLELNHARTEISQLRRAVDAVISGCTSTPSVPPQCPPLPAPAAWLMQPPPNSQQTLDRIISPSEMNLPSAGK